MIHMDNLPDPFPPDEDESPPVAASKAPSTPAEAEETLATDAEESLTTALAALRRRGDRAVTSVHSALSSRRVLVGVAVAIGAGLFFFAVTRRRGAPRRPRTLAGAVAHSLFREVASRVVLGAAAAVGARLAEAAVPMIVASISARQEVSARRPSRRRKARVED